MNATRQHSLGSTSELLHRLPCRWCLLRDTNEAEGEIEYDVLVDGDRRAVDRTLLASGACRVPSWGRSPHRQYVWWDDSLNRAVRLDLVDELAFGRERELRLGVRDPVLGSVARRDGWPRPSPSNEQWLALLHGLLDRQQLRPRDIARFDPWVGVVDDVVARTLPDSLVQELVDATRLRHWCAVEARRSETAAALRRGQPIGAMARRLWRGTMMHTTKLQRAILRPGVRVALLGPDGSGKSTTIEALQRSGVVSTSVYLGVAPAQHRLRPTVPGVALLWTIRRLLGAWTTATVQRRRGHSVALDRHPLEAKIGPATSKRTTIVRRWILAHVLPRPEAVVILMAPAEVLHARKPEHQLDDVIARRNRYLELAQRYDYPVVDTTTAPTDVVAEISRVVHGARRGRRRS
jgi:thymidylate kinase